MAEGRGSPVPPELSVYIQTTNYPSNPGKKLYKINKGYQLKRDKNHLSASQLRSNRADSGPLVTPERMRAQFASVMNDNS